MVSFTSWHLSHLSHAHLIIPPPPRPHPYLTNGYTGLLELVYTFCSTVPFTLVVYWMVGFTNEADPFFLFLLTVGSLSLATNSFGHLIVALMPNMAVAGVFGGLFTCVQMVHACVPTSVLAMLHAQLLSQTWAPLAPRSP
jgi:hypothetical protein